MSVVSSQTVSLPSKMTSISSIAYRHAVTSCYDVKEKNMTESMVGKEAKQLNELGITNKMSKPRENESNNTFEIDESASFKKSCCTMEENPPLFALPPRHCLGQRKANKSAWRRDPRVEQRKTRKNPKEKPLQSQNQEQRSREQIFRQPDAQDTLQHLHKVATTRSQLLQSEQNQIPPPLLSTDRFCGNPNPVFSFKDEPDRPQDGGLPRTDSTNFMTISNKRDFQSVNYPVLHPCSVQSFLDNASTTDEQDIKRVRVEELSHPSVIYLMEIRKVLFPKEVEEQEEKCQEQGEDDTGAGEEMKESSPIPMSISSPLDLVDVKLDDEYDDMRFLKDSFSPLQQVDAHDI